MSALADWAASGAMALTGRPDGPPMAAPGHPATAIRRQLSQLGVSIPGLLGERAAYTGHVRCGPWSCGRAFRTLPTRDGTYALSLSRPADIELLPALVESEVNDPWQSVAEWALTVDSADAEERTRLLGLPGGAVPQTAPNERPGVVAIAMGHRTVTKRPLVVDLTSLWAGPLCAHLLGRKGARVVKVESSTRPDGARRGSPDYFDLLNSGHERVVLDFRRDAGALRDLLASADLVLEASRPRALEQLGISAEQMVADGVSWLSITARGRTSDAVGFGDDVAACAGLVVRDGSQTLPVGDAVADPLTGVAAACAAMDALRSTQARLIDVSMLHTTAETVGPTEPHEVVRDADDWWVVTETGRHLVQGPRRRPPCD